MATINLRWYQERDVARLREAFRRKVKRVLYQLPTGGGKTFTFCYIANGASNLGRRVMILVHRQELLTQASLSLAKIGLRHTLIAQDKQIRQIMSAHVEELSNSYVDLSSRIAVASVGTLVNRLNITNAPDILIPDEAHHVIRGGTWGRIVDHYDDSAMLGVTATPIRTDGKGLGESHGGYFQELICGPTMTELIADGHLLRPKVFAPLERLDLSGVRSAGGDWSQKDLADRVDKPTITGSAVESYARVCAGLPAIAFCVSIEHSMHVAAQFRAAGFDFRHIDGTMHDAERRNLIRALTKGKIHGLTSCDIISEGTDIPVVGCGILLRPTKSEGLYLQQVGRPLRPYEGQIESFILDHVGNCFVHGLPEAEREWSLEGREKGSRKNKKDEGPKLMQCPKCYCTHEPASVCTSCGHVYESAGGREIKHEDGEIGEVKGEAAELLRKARKREEKKCRTLEDYVAFAEAQGYSNPKGWARLRMKMKAKTAAKYRGIEPPMLTEPPPFIR